MAEAIVNKYGVSTKFFKPKTYTVEEWWGKFVNYLDDRESKVWNKKEPIKSGDMAGKTMDVPNQLPLSIGSFCVFAEVSRPTFHNYEKTAGYEEYFEVTTYMREVIESDQFDGAVVGAYNPNIIARKLGLADKQEIKQTNIDEETDYSTYSDKDLNLLLEIENKYKK